MQDPIQAPMPEPSKPPTEQERLFDELKKNPAFLKQRNLLLGVTVIGGALMLGVAGLTFFKVLDLLDLISAIVVYVAACVFTSRPLEKMKQEAVERIKKEDEARARAAAWAAAAAEAREDNPGAS